MHNHFLSSRLLPLVVTALCVPCASAADLFVDASLATGAGDGSSWADAFQGTDGLQAAFAAAAAGDRIFVAQGTYRPTATGDRTASFHMLLPVEIYGGFLGGESSPEERPPQGAAPTILTGDLAGNDPADLSDNSLHVVRATGAFAGSALDGFIIRGGAANDPMLFADLSGGGLTCDASSRPTIRGCRFEDNLGLNQGGAVFVSPNAAPTFVACAFVGNVTGGPGGAVAAQQPGTVRVDRCHFEGNQAATGGALYYLLASNATVSNSTFVDNFAFGSGGGGAIASTVTGTLHVRNCTIVGNRAAVSRGGGVLATTAVVTLSNSVVWGNQGPGMTRNLDSQVSGVSSISYSIVEGIGGGAGNLDVDPGLVDLAGGDLSPSLASPAIDAGDNGAVAAPVGNAAAVDFAGFRRLQDEPSVPDTGLGNAPIVDIGAYEYSTLIGQPVCDGANNSTGVPARLDATGSTLVADDDVVLTTTNLPQNVFGYYLTSRLSGYVPNAGGSSGILCLGGAIGRFSGPGQIMNSGAAGEFVLALDLAAHPTPTGLVAVAAGETWRFQLWYRDVTLGFPITNYSEAVAVTFE